MSGRVELCSWIRGVLAEETLAEPLIVRGAYVPKLDVSTMGDGVYVTVVPKAATWGVTSRAGWGGDAVIDIAIQAKVPADESERDARCDALSALTDSIAVLLLNARLPADLDGRYHGPTKVENDPIYDPEQLEHLGVFFSLLTLTWGAV